LFFFQAEDGIRADLVTGVQTCALPIYAVGIEVPGNPVVDFFSLTPRQVAEHSYHDPDRFGIDPTKLPPEALQAMAGNRATLTVRSEERRVGKAGSSRTARTPGRDGSKQ